MIDFEGTIQLQEPITFDKMQEIFGSADQTERFYTTDADGNVTAEFINKSVIEDIREEIDGMVEESHDYNRAMLDALEVIDKHIKAVEE